MSRWPGNLGIVVVDTVLSRLLMPGITVGACLWAAQQQIGLFHAVSAPPWVAFIVTLVLLDGAIYAQHVVFHKVPVLWRMHRVHHTDPAFDVTTALRFHPIEILLSLLIKAVLAIVLGAPGEAAIVFEVVLSAAAIFSHANLRLPQAIDGILRLIIVTPDMHRIHHSVIHRETDSNFGFNLSIWDRLFGTYRANPADGHTDMTIGLGGFPGDEALQLWDLLKQPFQRR